MEALLPIAAKWKNIAMALRLKIDDIERIDACRQGSLRLQECLADVLTLWLRKKYNVERFGEPSWKKVIKVVATSAGGDNPTLAEKIAEQHMNPKGKNN